MGLGQKTPRKTTSQNKEEVGSSGGVKRPHSDSRTSSLEKQQTKRQRNTQVQTGSYKEAVICSRWRLFRRHPDVKLDQTQVDMIQAKLDCCGCKLWGDTTVIFEFQICTRNILDHLRE